MKGRLACAFGLLLVIGLAGAAAAAGPVRVTRPVIATRSDAAPTRTYASPVMAVDPENPLHVVAVAAEMRTRRCGLLRSTDAGRTWTHLETSPSPPGYPFCFITETGTPHGLVAFGRDHTLYYAFAGWDNQDAFGGWPMGTGGGWRGNVSVVLARSTDLGDSWQTTFVRKARGKEGPAQENNRPVTALVVDTGGDKDVVHVGWLGVTQERRLPMIAVSKDGGRNFSEPVAWPQAIWSRNRCAPSWARPRAFPRSLRRWPSTSPGRLSPWTAGGRFSRCGGQGRAAAHRSTTAPPTSPAPPTRAGRSR